MNKYKKDLLIAFSLDAFEVNISTYDGGPSVYPLAPDRSHAIFPSSLYFGRMVKSFDRYMYDSEPDNMRTLSVAVISYRFKDSQDLKLEA